MSQVVSRCFAETQRSQRASEGETLSGSSLTQRPFHKTPGCPCWLEDSLLFWNLCALPSSSGTILRPAPPLIHLILTKLRFLCCICQLIGIFSDPCISSAFHMVKAFVRHQTPGFKTVTSSESPNEPWNPSSINEEIGSDVVPDVSSTCPWCLCRVGLCLLMVTGLVLVWGPFVAWFWSHILWTTWG